PNEPVVTTSRLSSLINVDDIDHFCHAPSMLTRRQLCVAAGGAAAALLPPSAAGAQAVPAGPLVALLTPVRVFDSRRDSPLPGHRKLQSGESVGVFVSPA